ncbi:glycoside hydrolase family 16 protein [bacterium]|nr:MAG: glycoside hydrolase family 16 protein [bacterium]
MNGVVLLGVMFNPSWSLVWQDNFDKAGRPDPKKWNYETGHIRNNEVQSYTKDRKENARVEGGKLVIEARKDNFDGNPVTSASLTTSGIAKWTYGRFEVRAKVPTGRGTWPAAWFLGENMSTVGWPKCGEIDLMENVGYDPDKFHFNIHTQSYNHTKGTGKGTNFEVPNASSEFHDYALEWYPDRLDFFFDGVKKFTYAKETGATEDQWPYDKPQYMILNLAIGGAWGGQQGVDDAIFPAKYEIDHVRIYKQK